MAKYPDGLDFRKPKRGKVSKIDELQLEERRAKALRLSVRGKSLEMIVEISQREDWDPWAYMSRQTVHEDIMRGLRAAKAERNKAAGEWVENENLKLDALEEVGWEVMEALHLVVNQGEVVYVYEDEMPELIKQGWARPKLSDATAEALRKAASQLKREPLRDNKPKLDAMMALLKVHERRAKLNGWDAPIKKQVDVTTSGILDDRIKYLADRLAGGRGVEDLAGSGEGETGA